MFFNPNIHPLAEYKKRLDVAQSYAESQKMRLSVGKYNAENFFDFIKSREEKPERCNLCWQMRLKDTAHFARQNNVEYFTTTLLVSPYQDQNSLKNIGQKVEGQTGIKFLYEDFRPGFRESHNQAKKSGMYCQKYCGCSYSQAKRFNKC